mgnify:CR=1 FL=1
MGKIWVIVASVLRNKKKLSKEANWYNERLAICAKCEYNSKNYMGSKGLFHWFWNTINLSKPFCEICGCNLRNKLSEPLEQCPHPNGAKWTIVRKSKTK